MQGCLILCRFCAGNHNCYGFIGGGVLSRSEDTVLVWLSLTSDSQNLSVSSSEIDDKHLVSWPTSKWRNWFNFFWGAMVGTQGLVPAVEVLYHWVRLLGKNGFCKAVCYLVFRAGKAAGGVPASPVWGSTSLLQKKVHFRFLFQVNWSHQSKVQVTMGYFHLKLERNSNSIMLLQSAGFGALRVIGIEY